MPTITVKLDDGEVGGTGTKRLTFRPRQPFIDGDTIVTPDRFSKVVTRNTATTVTLRPGPWQVSGIGNQNPIPFDVGTDDANLKDLISLSISGVVPSTATLTEIVNAWLAEHGGGGGGGATSNATVAGYVSNAGDTRTAVDGRVTTVGDARYATTTQGAKADSAVQPAALTSGLAGKANTTHTHATGDITALTEYIQDAVNDLIQAGANVTKSYDDAANTLTISATGGGGGGTDAEVVRDTIAAALVASTGINIAVDDAADTITISVAGIPATAITTGTLPIARGGTGGTDAASARAALGAGTSNLAIGTTASTAAAGNDSRLTDTRTPTDGSVSTMKIVDGAVTVAKAAPDLGRVPLHTLYRPMTDIISSSVLVSDQYVTAVPGDYVNQWGTRWDSANLNVQGQNLVAVTAGTPASGCVNDSTGRYQVVSSTNVPMASVIDIEFLHTGDKLDIMMQTFGAFDTQVYIEDEGRMKKAKALPLAGNNSGYSYRSLRFAEIATRRIRIVMPAVYFIQVLHEQSAIVAPSPDRPLIVTTGDSYFEASGAYNSGSTRTFATYGMLDALIEATGFAVARCAQGGTGYFNDGTGAAGSLTAVASNTSHTSPFGSAPRVAYYGKFLGSVAKPVAVLVNGTINDGGLSGDGTNASQAGMQTRVTALLNAIAALDPKVGIVAIGPEPINDSYGSGAHATNRLGIQAAIAAHAQGIGFADANNPTTPWWTGTGYEKSVSTSQQAQMVGADQIHPNWFGHKYYGSRIAAAIGDFRVPKDRAERTA